MKVRYQRNPVTSAGPGGTTPLTVRPGIGSGLGQMVGADGPARPPAVRQSESAKQRGQIGHQDLVSARPCLNDSEAEEGGCGRAELSLRCTVLGQPRTSGDTEG